MGEEKSDAFELIACKYVRYALERAYMVLRVAGGCARAKRFPMAANVGGFEIRN